MVSPVCTISGKGCGNDNFCVYNIEKGIEMVRPVCTISRKGCGNDNFCVYDIGKGIEMISLVCTISGKGGVNGKGCGNDNFCVYDIGKGIEMVSSICTISGKGCRNSFKEGNITIGGYHIDMVQFGIHSGYSTSVSFCCKEDSNSTLSEVFPHDYPFVLLKGPSKENCEHINDMSVSEDKMFMLRHVVDWAFHGTIPNVTLTDTHIGIPFCFYQPESYSEPIGDEELQNPYPLSELYSLGRPVYMYSSPYAKSPSNNQNFVVNLENCEHINDMSVSEDKMFMLRHVVEWAFHGTIPNVTLTDTHIGIPFCFYQPESYSEPIGNEENCEHINDMSVSEDKMFMLRHVVEWAFHGTIPNVTLTDTHIGIPFCFYQPESYSEPIGNEELQNPYPLSELYSLGRPVYMYSSPYAKSPSNNQNFVVNLGKASSIIRFTIGSNVNKNQKVWNNIELNILLHLHAGKLYISHHTYTTKGFFVG
ncbi:unnamed protein product [Mytilus coruscus]|uniref:Uncharacterized protein n=1 Tax=Mytilus coruscus TaxID=42192 RepID=A0A6J8B029_MYTCO|nr:unnamed protein product [Mytilus coruscus]